MDAQPGTTLPEGELEQPARAEIARGEHIRVTGWIGLGDGETRLDGFANDRQVDLTFHADGAGPGRTSFEASIRCAGLGPQAHLQFFVTGADGRTRLWKKRKVWIDPEALPPPSIPVLRGKAQLDPDAGFVSGTIDASPHAVRSIAVMQAGICVGFGHLDGNGPTNFTLPLSPSQGSPALFHLRVGLGDGRPEIAWLTFDPLTGAILSEDLVATPEVGNDTDSHEPASSTASRIGTLGSLAALNGLSPGSLRESTGVFPPLDLSEETARILVEHETEAGQPVVTRFWRDDIDGDDAVQVPGFVFPPAMPRTISQKNATPDPHVVLFRREPAPTDELYVVAPLERLAERRPFAFRAVDTDTEDLTPERCDALLPPGASVIVSRYVAPVLLEALARNRTRLKDIFYIIDDDLTRARDDLGLPPRYRKQISAFAQTAFQAMVHLCTRLVVSSDVLARRFASTKTDRITPPYLYPAQDLSHLDDTTTIRIAYTGTVTHKTDFRFLAGILQNLLRKHANLELISFLGKFTPSAIAELPNVTARVPSTWDDFKQAGWRAHIGIAPMLRSPYNSGKSVVKVMDIARFGALGLYSNVEPFSGAVTDRHDGFLLDNQPAAWETCIEGLIASPDRIRPVAEQAQALARRLGDIDPLVGYWEQRLFGQADP